MVKIKRLITLLLLCVLLMTVGCAEQGAPADASGEISPASTMSATRTPAPTPKSTPTPAPLPDIGTLVAKYDAASGMVLTWAPFVTGLECMLERKDNADAAFKSVSKVDAESGTYTDAAPGAGGTQPVYRLRVSDGKRTAYSGEAKGDIPFVFGSTGGNLQNGGLVCEYGGVVYRLGIQDDEIGIYSLNAAGSTKLLVKGIASQLNVAGGYIYYLKQETGELYRIPVAGGESELIYEEKMVFMLVAGGRIYGTLDHNDALVAMNADGSGLETLAARGCYDLGAYGQTLYYTNAESGQFCMRNLVTGETKNIPLAERGFAQFWEGRIYYQDESNGRKLTSCAPDGSDVQVLLDQTVTGVNVTARGVYCVNLDDGNTLYRVALDGSEARQLTSVAGDYVNTVGEDLLLIDADGKFYQVGEDGTVTKLYG